MPGLLLESLLILSMVSASPDPLILIENGRPRAAIYAPADVINAPDRDGDRPLNMDNRPVAQRQRLRDSVRDLARCLHKMSGAKIDVIAGNPPANDTRLPIFIGDPAAKRFGPPAITAPFQQAFRLVVSKDGIGLSGESDIATSYAIYELLHRLGCRWFMPGELGECIPDLKTLTLAPTDESFAPFTIYRSIWHADEDYKRRNRMGGLYLSSSHALDSYIPSKQLAEHPEWVAVIGGRPRPPTLKWTRPAIADAIADTIVGYLDRGTYKHTVSLSPEDGMHWDESEDPKFDAGDFDPTFNTASVTDRLLVLVNRIAASVTAKHSDVLFGLLIYANYTRPPLREKLHPKIVPIIAPITYSRNHPVTDEREPNNRDLRRIYDQWGQRANMTGVYFYLFNLAEQFAPNPMIARMSVDVPYVMQRGCRFYIPETTSNFEIAMHGLYLGNRLAWDPTLDPAAIVDDINQRFYGDAAEPMSQYWRLADQCWVDTDEFSGSSFGHMRRFTDERLAKMRQLMNAALGTALTQARRGDDGLMARIQMVNESLILLEQYMKMRRDLNEGRWQQLDTQAHLWVGRNHAMAERYRAQFAFSARSYGAGGVWGNNNGVDFFEAFWKHVLDDAARIDRHHQRLTNPPLRHWRYKADPDNKGQDAGWSDPNFSDNDWPITDVATETWSTIGHHNHFGRMWYRATVTLPAAVPTRKTFLWIGSIEGATKVFVNGRHIPYVNPAGKALETYAGMGRPASFDISSVVLNDQPNQITLRCDRTAINEIGIGGLLAPAAVYRER